MRFPCASFNVFDPTQRIIHNILVLPVEQYSKNEDIRPDDRQFADSERFTLILPVINRISSHIVRKLVGVEKSPVQSAVLYGKHGRFLKVEQCSRCLIFLNEPALIIHCS